MIIGTGIDLASVRRLGRFRERRGERGLARLFTPAEIEYCRRAGGDASLAARFAAKEAFFKALGTGLRRGSGRWTDIEVVRAPSGEPSLRLHGDAARAAERRGALHVHVSLSHTGEVAVAVVVLEA
ncbi:MAG TPA: holo-ACP synthase [Longimicrobiales bacterium]|nr:holo-ACP synthase [Longimicrobiales bacterium]